MNPTAPPTPPAAPPPAQPAGRHRWPLIIVGMLIVHTGAIIYAASLALGDKSFAVVPDYYDKALAWDETRADQQAAADRGWAFDLLPGAFADDEGQRLVVARLSDAAGEPLGGAAVTLELYHHARAGDPARVAMRETAPGRHEAVAPVGADGTWRFNARVVRGDDRVTFERDVAVGAATPANPDANPGAIPAAAPTTEPAP